MIQAASQLARRHATPTALRRRTLELRPASFWEFDQDAATDTLGAAHLTGLANVSLVAGRHAGRALQSDSEFANAQTDAYNFERSDAWSVILSAYFANTDFGHIIGRTQGAPNYRGWELASLGTTTRQIRFILRHELGNELLLDSAASTITGWNHIAVSYDGSNTPAGVTMAVNGTQGATTGSNTLTGTTQITEPMRLFIRDGNDFGLANIAFDNAALWTRALTPAEIQSHYLTWRSRP